MKDNQNDDSTSCKHARQVYAIYINLSNVLLAWSCRLKIILSRKAEVHNGCTYCSFVSLAIIIMTERGIMRGDHIYDPNH